MYLEKSLVKCGAVKKSESESIKWMLIFILLSFNLFLLRGAFASEVKKGGAAVNADGVKTVSAGEHSAPYFAVSGDPKVDSFPLLKTNADVKIAGVSANIKLTQVYKNDGKRTIEAVYVFPLSTKSAIHAMRMKIGSRIIEADIQETEKARQIYQAAKREGKTASLLEQKRPNVFEMKVANIMPGDVVEVEVDYTEILVPLDAVYEFVFPTVVGPRFTGETDGSDPNVKGADVKGSGENFPATPYLHEGDAPTYKFDIKVDIKTGIPLADVWVTSHKAHIEKTEADEAIAVLTSPDGKGGNKDFILRYKLQGDAIQTGLLLYPGEEEKFFVMMLEPPEKVELKDVPPREYVFIVDVSGSMNGFPLEVSKALMNEIINNLREEDYFNILFFAGSANTLFAESQPATEENKDNAVNRVSSQRGGGGTYILNAMQKALDMKKKEGMSRILVIATDGYVNVEKRVFDLMRDKLGEANFFSFGIGRGVNRYIIEGMARVGKGEPYVVTNEKEAKESADKFIDYIRTPLLTDIKVSFDGFDAYDVEPPAIPDLFYKRPLVMMGKYKNAAGKVKVTGNTAAGTYNRELTVSAVLEDQDNSALKFLWAREKIAGLADYGRVGVDVKEEVTQLGLKYHLMTDYTSFVAVDKVIRDTGEIVTVKQPLPLPEGVSDLAVGSYGYTQMQGAKSIPAYSSGPKTYYMKGSARPHSAPSSSMGGARNLPAMFDPSLVKKRETVMAKELPTPVPPPPAEKVETAEMPETETMKLADALTGEPADVEEEIEKELGKDDDKVFGVNLVSGKLPSGLSLEDVKRLINDKIKKEIMDAVKGCGLKRMKIALKVEKGKVTAIEIKDNDPKKCKEEAVVKIFMKLIFKETINGAMELDLKFI